MSDLVAFLRARLDEDEAAARAATAGPWTWGIPSPAYWRPNSGASAEDLLEGAARRQVLMTSKAGAISFMDAEHIARWDPSRVLAEVAAKRAILDRLAHCLELPGDSLARRHATATFLYLAQPYVGHPDFDPAWATEGSVRP